MEKKGYSDITVTCTQSRTTGFSRPPFLFLFFPLSLSLSHLRSFSLPARLDGAVVQEIPIFRHEYVGGLGLVWSGITLLCFAWSYGGGKEENSKNVWHRKNDNVKCRKK